MKSAAEVRIEVPGNARASPSDRRTKALPRGSPLKIQWVRLRRFTFYFLRAPVVKVPRLDAPTGKSKLFFLVAAIRPVERAVAGIAAR